MTRLLNLSCRIALLVCAAGADIGYSQEPSQVQLDTVETNMLTYLNQYRQQHGRQPLTPTQRLMDRARSHAKWMADHLSMEHRYDNIRENIASGTRSSRQATDLWIASSGHAVNMLTSQANCGVGYAQNPNGQTYWCQVFANDGNNDGNNDNPQRTTTKPAGTQQKVSTGRQQANSANSSAVSTGNSPQAGKGRFEDLLPDDAKYPNSYGYCTWACFDTAARRLGVRNLIGVTKARWEANKHNHHDPGYDHEIIAELDKRGVKYEFRPQYSNKDTSLLEQYANTLGVIVSFNQYTPSYGCHTVYVIGYDDKTVIFYDSNRKTNNHPETILRTTREWFDKWWLGSSVVVFPPDQPSTTEQELVYVESEPTDQPPTTAPTTSSVATRRRSGINGGAMAIGSADDHGLGVDQHLTGTITGATGPITRSVAESRQLQQVHQD